MHTITTFLNRIICGDCTSVMREMPGASVDLVVTDPPYLVRYRSRDGRAFPNDDNDRWLRPAFAEVAACSNATALWSVSTAGTRPTGFLPPGRRRGCTPSAIWSGPKTTTPPNVLCAIATSPRI